MADALSERRAWVERVIERDPKLAEILKDFGVRFQARVTRCEHVDPDLCRDEGGDGLVAVVPWIPADPPPRYLKSRKR